MTRTADTLLRCPKCRTAEDPAAPNVGPALTGAANQRRHHNVVHVRCASCRHAWWSTSKRAHALRQAALDAGAAT